MNSFPFVWCGVLFHVPFHSIVSQVHELEVDEAVPFFWIPCEKKNGSL